MSKKIIIVAGDPNSVNVELIHKVWKILDQRIKKKILLIANFELIKTQLKRLKSTINLRELNFILNLLIINISLCYFQLLKLQMFMMICYLDMKIIKFK